MAANVAARLAEEGVVAEVVKPSLFANQGFRWFRGALGTLALSAPGVAADARELLVVLETLRFVEDDLAAAADRADVVLCDRHVESSRMYLAARGLRTDRFDEALAHHRAPDLTILIDVPLDVSVRRLNALGENGTRQSEFLHQMQLEICSYVDRIGAQKVDGCDSQSAVAERVRQLIIPRLALRPT